MQDLLEGAMEIEIDSEKARSMLSHLTFKLVYLTRCRDI